MSNLDRCRFTISNNPGTGGALTVGSAVSGAWVVPGTDQNNQAFEACVVQGSDFEIFETVYTHSGTSLSRGALIKSNTGSRINLSSGAECFLTVSARQFDRYDSAALAHIAGSNANTTMAVGALYVVDGATLTADRTYTLPATAAVGDRVGVMMSAGSASWEVLLTAASGDTLNGVAGGTEWSRLFITGETVVMRCVVANTTWVVEQDGRIRSRAGMEETSATTMNHATFTLIGLDSELYDVGDIANPGTGAFTIRRAGTYELSALVNASAVTSARVIARVYKNGSADVELARAATPTVAGTGVGSGSGARAYAAGDSIELYGFWSVSGGSGSTTTDVSAGARPYLNLLEVL